jgi:hypothetical protein
MSHVHLRLILSTYIFFDHTLNIWQWDVDIMYCSVWMILGMEERRAPINNLDHRPGLEARVHIGNYKVWLWMTSMQIFPVGASRARVKWKRREKRCLRPNNTRVGNLSALLMLGLKTPPKETSRRAEVWFGKFLDSELIPKRLSTYLFRISDAWFPTRLSRAAVSRRTSTTRVSEVVFRRRLRCWRQNRAGGWARSDECVHRMVVASTIPPSPDSDVNAVCAGLPVAVFRKTPVRRSGSG